MQRLKKIGKIIPKKSKDVVSSRLGLGFEKLDRDAFDPELAYDHVAETGVKWIRIQSGWAKTEKVKGVYDFSWLDSIVDNLLARGLKPWMCLCYGNALYSEAAKEVYGAVGVPPIHTEEERTAWINYVKALVNRYKDRIDHYEVWNEPDGEWCWKHGPDATELAAFTSVTGKAIHEVFPEAEVIGFVICIYPYIEFLSKGLCTTDVADNIDAISFHGYTPNETKLSAKVSTLRAVADFYKPGLKIVDGETGSQSKAGGAGACCLNLWTEKAQAKQLTRHAVLALSTEVEFTSYFSCIDMKEALNGKVGDAASYKDYGYFGIIGADFDDEGNATGNYYRKPSFYALQTLGSVFSEEYETVKDTTLSDMPSFFAGYEQQDYSMHSITKMLFRRKNGSECLVYWNPANILTTDLLGSVSFTFLTKNDKFALVDLMTGDVYALDDKIVTKVGENYYKFEHLPATDTPLALIMGDFCEWRNIK